MEDDRIIFLVRKALTSLIRKDHWLLVNNLNEPCISHKLAEHLQARFIELNVDCEYNGDIDRGRNGESARKRINFNEESYIQLNNGNPIEGTNREVQVFPDIIIHQRGSNANNLCIIELKKSTNADRHSFEFERVKLQSYTSMHYGNNLGYQIGIFIILNTNIPVPTFDMEFYKAGSAVEIPVL